jgi:hypothetical protein
MIVTGAGVLLYINGQFFAWVSSIQWQVVTAQKEIFAVDSNSAYELAPGQAKAGGTLGLYRLHGDGGATGAQITTQFQALVRQKYFTLVLVDKLTHETLFSAARCALEVQSWSAAARGFVTGQFSFKALEAEDAVPAPPA